MSPVLAISVHAGIRLAEVGYLLILIAGIWLLAGQLPWPGGERYRTIVAGAALAIGAVLLLIATHWGHYG